MNPCGECTACCDSLGFTHVNDYTQSHPDVIVSLKVAEQEGIVYDYGSACNKLCPNSGDCTIYERRPHVCSSFECSYLRYDLDIETRPDQCGFVVDADDPALHDGWVMVTPWLHGQKDIDVDVWRPENHSKIKQVLEDLSMETGRRFNGYLVQCSNKYAKGILYEVFDLH